MSNSIVTNARILKIAAAAGCTTTLRHDGPGRYILGSESGNGACLIQKLDDRWCVSSPISDGAAPKTLGTALSVAARLVAREAEMSARAAALTDAQIEQELADPTIEYHYRQRVLGQRCLREYAAKKAATALPVENPTIVRLANENGLTITTDQQGKDDARAQLQQHGGLMVESRYFVNGVLFTREIGTNPKNGLPTFEWKCGGETFTNPVDAVKKALTRV